MSTLSNTPRTTIKTRDKLKYAFAGILAFMTIVAIGGLMLARYQRHQTTVQEEIQVQQTLSIYGQEGALPEKLELPDSPPAGGLVTK